MRSTSRDALLMVSFVLASALIVGVGYAIWGHDTTPRSDRHAVRFQRYVDQYIGGWRSQGKHGVPQRDRRWAVAHPEKVLREGDQACAWLAQRASAPDVDPSRRYSVDGLISTYLHDPAVDAIADVDPMSRRAITAGAWSYLCLAVRQDKTAPLPDTD